MERDSALSRSAFIVPNRIGFHDTLDSVSLSHHMVVNIIMSNLAYPKARLFKLPARSTVYGAFEGTAVRQGDMLSIEGESEFHFRDVFTDPLDLRQFSAWLEANPLSFWRLVDLIRVAYAVSGVAPPPPGFSKKVDVEDVSSIFRFISEVGGTRYEIVDEWKASFRADVFRDPESSVYKSGNYR